MSFKWLVWRMILYMASTLLVGSLILSQVYLLDTLPKTQTEWQILGNQVLILGLVILWVNDQ